MHPSEMSSNSGDYHNKLSVRGSVATAMMKLLTDADKTLDSDRQAAKFCIVEASALWRVERDRIAPAPVEPRARSRSGLAPWQINKVKDHIEANLESSIRVETLAGISRLSRSYFSVAFKRSVGETLPAYLSRRRVERAKVLMLATDLGLCQIALDCGFCDQAHLSRMFRRLIGVAPNRWRRQRLQQPV